MRVVGRRRGGGGGADKKSSLLHAVAIGNIDSQKTKMPNKSSRMREKPHAKRRSVD